MFAVSDSALPAALPIASFRSSSTFTPEKPGAALLLDPSQQDEPGSGELLEHWADESQPVAVARALPDGSQLTPAARNNPSSSAVLAGSKDRAEVEPARKRKQRAPPLNPLSAANQGNEKPRKARKSFRNSDAATVAASLSQDAEQNSSLDLSTAKELACGLLKQYTANQARHRAEAERDSAEREAFEAKLSALASRVAR